ncbi:helix-turn-helix domain-containing protein [Priestia megaterium]|uniref:helix-turn-helix domain-containing protein n=1 Tax=Priestia megaterium TaxID=1404 RepID=UPI0023DC631E|nr:helix-turn-helix domain-containing protein [Priestia megaterium]MDF2010184.1 helix-turn-helix domain-containing protein [Priestia megaterium]
MEQKMFTVSIDKEFDVMKKEFSNSIYLRVYTSLFKAGIVKDLKATNFTVLLAISSFMDAEGNCYPTQRQIAELTGMSVPTVNKAVNELLAFEVDGKSILKRELVQVGQFKNSYYTVNPISQIAIFDGQIQETETDAVKETESSPLKNLSLNNTQELNPPIQEDQADQFKNAKDVAIYFLQKYEEVYGTTYNIVWARDLGLIKKKLFSEYSSEQLKKMIDSSIERYESTWKKPAYPRPTIPMMASWLGMQALAVIEDTEKDFKELETLTAGSEEMNSSVLKKFGV